MSEYYKNKQVKNLDGEIWMPYQEDNYFEASNFGRIRAKKREIIRRKSITGRTPEFKVTVKEKILSQIESRQGYLRVGINRGGVMIKKLAHRVIAESWIPNTENKPFINHINGIKTDNRIENLEWCTRSENEYHAWRIGLKSKENRSGEKSWVSKLTDENVYDIVDKINSGMSIPMIVKNFYPNVSWCALYGIKARRTWKHLDLKINKPMQGYVRSKPYKNYRES